MNSRGIICLCLLCLLANKATAQEKANSLTEPRVRQLTWELGPTGSRASLRGLSAGSDGVIWTCGSHGTVLRSLDGGSSWMECGPAEFSDLEFRSIHAWNGRLACIASAGSPAVVLRTDDGGTNWREVYRHRSPAAFFDGMKFWDNGCGIVFGDPIDGAFCILETTDGGERWRALAPEKSPAALASEAAFAASNSAMIVSTDGQVWIGTGGPVTDTSRVLLRRRWSDDWKAAHCPLVSSPTSGIFSLARAAEENCLVAVGGDYRETESSRTTAAFSTDEGQTWQLAPKPPASFCSAVVSIALPKPVGSLFVATGPAGSFLSQDGRHWQPFSDRGFHVLAATSSGLYAAGADGRFARLAW